jgi:hypothetical protein
MTHDADAPLVPTRERTIEFYGDQAPAAQLADGTIMAPLRPIAEALGLDWSAQAQRLKRDARLRAAQGVVMITTPGGRQTMTVLPLRLLPGWLFKIDTARVRPELRGKIERYQEEAYEVLWQAFKGDILPATTAGPDLAGADLAVEQARAVLHLAEQQQAAEQALARHEQALAEQGGALTRLSDKQEAMAGYLRPFVQDTRQRLTALELQLSAGATISEAQAAELALAVKNVGQRLAATGDKTGYQKVYGELYRREGISSYKSLPAARLEAVLAWLRAWYAEFGGADAGA